MTIKPAKRQPIASDRFIREVGIPDRYKRTDGTAVTWERAGKIYRQHRIGQDASAEANGYTRVKTRHASRLCAIVHDTDREYRAKNDSPIICMLTFAGSHDPGSRFGPVLDYQLAIKTAIDLSWEQIRYHLFTESTEYVLVEGGTERGVPHYHLLTWADTTRDQLGSEKYHGISKEIVQSVQTNLPPPIRYFDPRTEAPAEAVQIESSPSCGLRKYEADGTKGPVHPMVRYVANQVPHLSRGNDLSENEVLIGAIADASSWKSFRSSSGVYSKW